MRYSTLLGVALCLCVSGCNRATLVKRITPAEDEAFARDFVDLLRGKAFDRAEQKLDPSIAGSDTRNKLPMVAEMFPAGEPNSAKVVAYNFGRIGHPLTHTLTLEYEFPNKWILVDVLIKRGSSASTVLGFRASRIADSLEHANRFRLSGKKPQQYGVLALAIAAPLFSFYVLAVCLRTKNLDRKWLWAILILVGVGKLGVNWTTGALSFTPLAIYVPCGEAMTTMGFYGPWVVSAHLPLAAILFLAKRRKSVAPSEAQPFSHEGVPGI